MASNDSINVTQGVGTKMATDNIGDVVHPVVKIEFGAPGDATHVSQSTPLPVTSSGLTLGGRYSRVNINDSTWTALPAVPLPNRNELNIQNDCGFDVKINYDYTGALPSGFVGYTLANGNERNYSVKSTVAIFAKSATGSGTVSIGIEELA